MDEEDSYSVAPPEVPRQPPQKTVYPPAGQYPPVGPGGAPPGPHRVAYGRPPTAAEVSGEFPVQAAKFSLYAAVFAFFINFFAVRGGGAMPAVGLVLVAVICGLLILGGFVLGILALVQNRRRQLPGVRGYAIAGIAINGLFILLNILLLSRLLLS